MEVGNALRHMPRNKRELCKIGMQLQYLSDDDVIALADPDITERDVERKLRSKRLAA